MKTKEMVKKKKTISERLGGRKNLRNNLELTLLALPTFLTLLFFRYVPMPGIIVSFKRYNFRDGIFGSKWNGFKNFEYVFSNTAALDSMRNTVLYNLVFIVLGLVIGIGLALVMNNIMSKKCLKFYQTAIFIPYYLSWSIVTYILYAFLSNGYGMVNRVLESLGLERIMFYDEKKYWPFILTFMHFWKGFGYSTLLYYARILGIDPSYYEAASLDGASRWQQAVYITIPGLAPIIFISLINSIGNILNSDFSMFWMLPMNSSLIKSVTSTLDTYSYAALRGGTGIAYGAAVGFFKSVVSMILILLANGYIKRTFGAKRAMF